MWAIFWIGFVSGLLGSSLVFLFVYRRYQRIRILEMENILEVHRKDWEELHHKLNHSGAIPNAATTLGLLRLILLAISSCIANLKRLFDAKDWNTHLVIIELQEITANELAYLHKKLGDFLDAQRQYLMDYNDRQEKKK